MNWTRICTVFAAAALLAFTTGCESQGAAAPGASTESTGSEASGGETAAVDPAAEAEAHGPDDEHAAEHDHAHEDGDGDHDHAGHDHAGHDHAGHDHDDHDHAGHDHAGHDHAGHDHVHDETPGNMDSLLEPGDYDPADLVAQPGASVGDPTTCLVSGEVFEVTDDSPFIEHDGQTIYFCCSSCIRRFQRDPGTYLSGGEAAAEGGRVQVAAEGTTFDPPVAKAQIPAGAWICDMGTVHYAATEPGSCPLCGMRLTEHTP